ncbi:hypothetical protein F4679DRAFT_599995 [Xylaria curta]|nr:hypothetical protein F4679DRAFT_599995 [Xylaria curta]
MAEYTKDTKETQNTNAQLCITALSPGLAYYTLLQSIATVGRVKELRIKSPNKINPKTCTANVTFFSHDAAQKLLDLAENGEFLVEGTVPTVFWNTHVCTGTPANSRGRLLWIFKTPEIVTRGH